MKILSVNCFYPPFEPNGGATVYAHSLNKELQIKGNKVYVFCGKLDTKSELHSITNDTFEKINITRIVLNYQSFDDPIKRITGDPLILKHFKECLDKIKPDIVHFHAIQGLGAELVKFCIKNNYKTAITLHDSWWLCPRQFFLKSDKKTYCKDKNCINCSFCYGFAEEKSKTFKNIKKNIEIFFRDKYLYRIINNVDICIFPSQFLYTTYSRYLKKKNWIISQNGIDDSKSIQKIEKSNKIRFLFVGGNSEEKGCQLLVRTWEKYFSTKKDIELDIYGQGSELLNSQIKAKNIHINGIYDRENFQKIFATHDVLVFPSIIPENSPITIKEASSFGMAIIGSDIGGIPELISNKNNGLIFKNKSQKDLSIKINKLITDKHKLLIMQKKSLLNYKSIKTQTEEILTEFKKVKLANKKNINNNILLSVEKIIYNRKDHIKTNNYISTKLTKHDKTLLFNLDNSKKRNFTEMATCFAKKTIYEIYKTEATKITDNKFLINKNKIINWIKIKNIVTKNNINTLAIPYPEIKYFNKKNQIFFALIGIKKYVLVDQKLSVIEIEKKHIYKNYLKSINELLKKTLIIIFFSILTFINLIIASIFTTYVHKEMNKQLIKFKKLSLKAKISNILLIPLKIIRVLTNYLLIKLINI